MLGRHGDDQCGELQTSTTSSPLIIKAIVPGVKAQYTRTRTVLYP